MAEVKFKRTTNINNVDVEDGTFLVDYQNQKAYIDVENQRIPFAGSTIVNTTYNESNNETYCTNYINNVIENKKVGKLLWEGSFSSGSITVDGISDYNTIVIEDSDGVILYGNQKWGIGGFNVYQSYTTNYRTYRFSYNSSDETLTINNDDRGATDGTQTIPIIKIYGLF